MNKNLTTAQKRVFVDVLESFPTSSLKENLSLKCERNKYLLGALSYNKLSKSKKHAEAVKSLRDNNLKSWNGRLEEKLKLAQSDTQFKPDALNFLSQRPGIMIRMLVRLYRLGYTQDDLKQVMLNETFLSSLSYQTLVSNLQYFGQNINDIYKDTNNIEGKEGREMEITFAYDIFYEVLKAKMRELETPLKDKKVFLDNNMYNLDHSIIETNAKGADDTYFRSGLAFDIPEEVKRLRFFIYWNDKKNIDIDLHSYGMTTDNKSIHIGWNADFNHMGITFSGDIRHSNAAEYIDIDLEKAKDNQIAYINNDVRLFSGASNFREVKEVFTGMMAVSDNSKNIKLYNSQNVFFRHDLNALTTELNYSYIDIANRILRLKGQRDLKSTKFSLNEYLHLLYETQNIKLIDNKDDAEIILTIEKVNDTEKGISLLDENFFFES